MPNQRSKRPKDMFTALRNLSRPQYDQLTTWKMMCPAAGAAPTATCELKPRPDAGGKKDKAVVVDVPKNPDDVCTHEMVTMHLIKESRYLQPLQYKSPEWRRMYTFARNLVEGKSAHAKTQGAEAIAEPGRRRLRGLTAQSVLMTFLVVSSNLRQINSFEQNAARPEERRTKRTRRKTIYNKKHYEPRLAGVREAKGLPPLEGGGSSRVSKPMN